MMSNQSTAAFKAKVVQELLKAEKTLVQIAAAYEVHPTQLKKWRAIVLAGMADLFEKQESIAQVKAAYEQQQTEVDAELGKLTNSGDLAEKKGSTLRREERVGQREREGSDLPLSVQAELLGISRSRLD
jgi:transposase